MAIFLNKDRQYTIPTYKSDENFPLKVSLYLTHSFDKPSIIHENISYVMIDRNTYTLYYHDGHFDIYKKGMVMKFSIEEMREN